MFTQPRSRPVSSTFLAILIALGILLLLTTLTFAKSAGTIIVNPGDSIQAAIDSATPGDTILINAGTYTESLTLNKAVSLTGVSSATVIIHAIANQRVLTVSGAAINNSVVISGFIVASGYVTGGITWNSCPVACGGGVLITGTAQPIIQNLIITGNSASAMGGGLYADGPLALKSVVLVNNKVYHDGGGAYINGEANVANSQFQGNSCIGSIYCVGGGLMAGNTLIINNSQFISNTVVAGTYGGLGAGVYAGRAVTVTDSVFEGNQCTGSFCTGGGLYAFTTLTANDTVFKNNSATEGGGGAYAVGDAILFNARLENNLSDGLYGANAVNAIDIVVLGNQYYGLRAKSAVLVRGHFEDNPNNDIVAQTLVLTGTQFSGNSAGQAVYLNNYGTPSTSQIVNALFIGSGTAVYMVSPSSNLVILQSTIAVKNLSPLAAIIAQQGTVGITNTIVASHTLGIQQGSGTVYEDYNLFYGNTTDISGTIGGGTHDVFGNPNFVDPVNDDYHIVPPSAAINAGVDAGVYTDLDGNVRPIGGGFDIGAYEATNVTTPITGLVAVNDSPTRLSNATMFVASVQAGDSVSYLWDFGDGSALGTYQTVAHTYPAVGIYTAIVTASNSVSVVTATTRVTVDIPLSGLLAVNDSPTLLGNVTTLTATIGAGSNVAYTWNFGDGSASAGGITTTHVYPAGVYTASVVAQNSVSALTATTHVTITDVPVSGLTAVNNSPTAIGNTTTLTATISAGSNVTYTWDFGDGSTTSIGQVVTRTYPFSITSRFTATVTALNSVSTQSATTTIIIIPKRIYLPVVLKS